MIMMSKHHQDSQSPLKPRSKIFFIFLIILIMAKTPGKYFWDSNGQKYSKNIVYNGFKHKKIQQDTQHTFALYTSDILDPYAHSDGLQNLKNTAIILQ